VHHPSSDEKEKSTQFNYIHHHPPSFDLPTCSLFNFPFLFLFVTGRDRSRYMVQYTINLGSHSCGSEG